MKKLFVAVGLMFFITACGPELQLQERGSGNAEATTDDPKSNSGQRSSSTIPDELVLKLRVYQLRFPGSSDYNSSFSADVLRQYVEETNQIYAQAKIRFQVESIQTLDAPSSVQFVSGESNQSFVQKIQKIKFPATGGSSPLFQVAFFYGFPISAKGLYVANQKVAYIGEYFLKTGELQGSVVLAHELGHQLSLPHANESGQACADSNLLCTGGTGIGTYLTPEQIDAIRRQAIIGPATK